MINGFCLGVLVGSGLATLTFMWHLRRFERFFHEVLDTCSTRTES